MKTTRLASIFLFVVLVLSLLAGCAAPQPAAEQPAADPATEAVAADAPAEAATGKVTELTVWSFIDQHLTFFQKMAETWNAEHPDEQIAIVPTKIPWTEIHDQLYAGMMAGEGLPDIADIEISRWPQFMEGDVQLLDLNPYAEPYKADLVAPIMDVFSKDGHLYGAPSHLGATVMYYNTELLEQGGVDYTTIKTWADYEKALKTYKDNTGKYMNYCETYGAYQFTVLLGEQGKDLIDDQGMPQLTTPEAMKAVAEIKKWKDEDICSLIPGGNADTDEGKAAVANGDVAALMYPLWYMSRFSDEMPQLAGKIAIAPLPVWDDSSYKSMGLGGTGTTVYKNSPNADLAARFITWAKLSELGSATLWTDIGFDPINVKVYENLEVTKDPGNKFLQYFQTNPFDVLFLVKDQMFTIKTMQNTGTINTYLSTNTWNRILVDGEDPVTVMEETQAELMSQADPQD
ncbi:MAG: carbohydrate ABC transporter substrate-binding protein [Anaerolineales bacterium]|nr:carbohydrate ABC transporter substrate-binding protein [Anaerolineales bacterium]